MYGVHNVNTKSCLKILLSENCDQEDVLNLTKFPTNLEKEVQCGDWDLFLVFSA